MVVGSQELSLHIPKPTTFPVPSVLVFHSAAGRTESVLEWCDELARAGFGAVALDFYGGKIATKPDESKTLRDGANAREPELQRMVEQTYDLLQNDSRLRSQKRFLLGWSFGAAWATFASGFLPNVKAVVAYYGEDFRMNPGLYDKTEAPILFVGARRDTDPSPEQLQEIADHLTGKGKSAELLLVDATHGFAERTHAGYNEQVASNVWKKVLCFLEDDAR